MKDQFFNLLSTIGLILLMLMSTSTSQAQSFAKINLRNYTKLKGNILQSFDSTGIILSVDGTPMHIPYSQIRTIKLNYKKRDEFKAFRDQIASEDYSFPQFEKGYYHSIGLGVISGSDYSNLSASLVNGYKFHKHLHTGLGVNYDRYDRFSAIPIYAEAKGFVKEGKFVPFYFGHIGYGFTVEDSRDEYYNESFESTGGLYWKIGLGYQVNFYKTALALSIGYGNQNSTSEYLSNYYYPSYSSYWPGPPTEVSEKRSLRRVDVKINLLF